MSQVLAAPSMRASSATPIAESFPGGHPLALRAASLREAGDWLGTDVAAQGLDLVGQPRLDDEVDGRRVPSLVQPAPQASREVGDAGAVRAELPL